MFKRISILLFLLFALATWSDARELVCRIVEYNKDTQAFILAQTGERPEGSYAVFENDFGATTGNRYNQIPRNRQAQLWLDGWKGCTIKAITFNMCSNSSSGTVGYSILDGQTVLHTERPVDFADPSWYGEWVNKDQGTYVDIRKEMTVPALASDTLVIVIKGGTSEGSVYLNSLTIEYDTPEDMTCESPLGWVYEKLEKKSILAVGDKVMIYRAGSAATDFDGMETSHYLDAMGITNTQDVTEPGLTVFTLGRDESGQHWTLTDQYGRLLGAKGVQNLAWNEGVITWDITLGYDGATIASTQTNYGTLRYNAPVGSYARFWNYSSKTLPLPYLYRRVRQLEESTKVESSKWRVESQKKPIKTIENGRLIIIHDTKAYNPDGTIK